LKAQEGAQGRRALTRGRHRLPASGRQQRRRGWHFRPDLHAVLPLPRRARAPGTVPRGGDGPVGGLARLRARSLTSGQRCVGSPQRPRAGATDAVYRRPVPQPLLLDLTLPTPAENLALDEALLLEGAAAP